MGNLNEQTYRDEQKAVACDQIGITLITVPYWWNGNEGSLLEMIQKKRNDIRREIAPKSASEELKKLVDSVKQQTTTEETQKVPWKV